MADGDQDLSQLVAGLVGVARAAHLYRGSRGSSGSNARRSTGRSLGGRCSAWDAAVGACARGNAEAIVTARAVVATCLKNPFIGMRSGGPRPRDRRGFNGTLYPVIRGNRFLVISAGDEKGSPGDGVTRRGRSG